MMKKPKDTTPMITKSSLKSKRGWTDKLLKMFLPDPDLVKANPHYKSGPKMQLFNLARIEAIEKTKEFKAQQEITAKRKQAAEKAVETKWEQLWDYLSDIEIDVPVLDRAELVELACDHYKVMQSWREAEGRYTCDLMATADSEPRFLERICVNYLRHCLTKYEAHLDAMSGKVGFDVGYEIVRRRVFSAISEKYGWLADECERQEKAK